MYQKEKYTLSIEQLKNKPLNNEITSYQLFEHIGTGIQTITRKNIADVLTTSFFESRGNPHIQKMFFEILEVCDGFNYKDTIKNFLACEKTFLFFTISKASTIVFSEKEKDNIFQSYNEIHIKTPKYAHKFKNRIFWNKFEYELKKLIYNSGLAGLNSGLSHAEKILELSQSNSDSAISEIIHVFRDYQQKKIRGLIESTQWLPRGKAIKTNHYEG